MSTNAGSGFDTRLDWSDPDTISEGEAAALLDWYVETHGEGSVDLTRFVPFLIENAPGSFKRYRRNIQVISGEPGGLPQAAVALLFLHHYMVIGNPKGAFYEVIAAREWGATKAEVLSTIHLSFLESGPFGANAVAELATDYLRDWVEPTGRDEPFWPDGWGPADPDSARSGLDFGADELGEEERGALFAWFEQDRSAVPAHVRLLASHRPAALKSLRGRYEHALAASALPAQMWPLFHLHTGTILDRSEAVSEAARHARRLGVTKQQALETFCWALLYVTETTADTAAEALEPFLESWT